MHVVVPARRLFILGPRRQLATSRIAQLSTCLQGVGTVRRNLDLAEGGTDMARAPRSPKSRIQILALAFAMVTGSTLVGQGVAHASSSLVTVSWGAWKQYSQQEGNWCWAAGAKMIVQKSLGSSASECTLVKYGRNSSACDDIGGTMVEMKRAISTSSVATSGPHNGTVSFSTVRSRTLAGGGVLNLVTWVGGGRSDTSRRLSGVPNRQTRSISHLFATGPFPEVGSPTASILPAQRDSELVHTHRTPTSTVENA